MIFFVAKLLASYLLGSIAGSLVLGRARGVDIRTQGSGNAGATNALRTLGWRFALGVMLIDVGKGAIAVLLIGGWAQETDPVWLQGAGPLACGLAAALGHCFPVWFGFRGGKGAGTLFGAYTALFPWAALLAFGGWLLSLMSTGYVGFSTVCAAAILVLAVWGFGAGLVVVGADRLCLPAGAVDASRQSAAHACRHRTSVRTRAGAQMVSRLGLGLLLLSLLAACSTTQVRRAEGLEADSGIARGKTVLLLPPEVQLTQLTASGIEEPRADWTASATSLIGASLKQVLDERSARLRNYAEPEDLKLQERFRQLRLLHEAVGGAIANYGLFSGIRLAGKGEAFDWSLGPGVRTLKQHFQADYALYTAVYDSYSSGGRKGVMALGLLLGSTSASASVLVSARWSTWIPAGSSGSVSCNPLRVICARPKERWRRPGNCCEGCRCDPCAQRLPVAAVYRLCHRSSHAGRG